MNLGSGRGRVRRVALKMPDGQQINLLAVGFVASSGVRHRAGQDQQKNRSTRISEGPKPLNNSSVVKQLPRICPPR